MAPIRAGRLADSLRVMTVIVLSLAIVSCSASSSTPVPIPTPTTASGPTLDPSHSPAAAGSSIASSAALECRNYIDQHQPPPDFEKVLDVVALPTSSKATALQTGRTGDPDPAVRLFAKTGLVIKAGTKFELVVPDEAKDMVSIGWGGAPSTPSRRITVSCPARASLSGWQVYAGGYWAFWSACVPLIVRAGGKEQRVLIGLGTPCPGQLPPQGPSDQ